MCGAWKEQQQPWDAVWGVKGEALSLGCAVGFPPSWLQSVTAPLNKGCCPLSLSPVVPLNCSGALAPRGCLLSSHENK